MQLVCVGKYGKINRCIWKLMGSSVKTFFQFFCKRQKKIITNVSDNDVFFYTSGRLALVKAFIAKKNLLLRFKEIVKFVVPQNYTDYSLFRPGEVCCWYIHHMVNIEK